MTTSPVLLVGGIGMTAVAVAFVVYAFVRKLGVGYLALGAAAWVVTVAVKIVLALIANAWVRKQTLLLGEPTGTAIFSIYLGLLTGVTEVALVWVFLRFTRFGRVRWPRVLAFGIGFGAIEALLLGLSSLVLAVVALTMPERLPKEVLGPLERANNLWMQLAPISERIFACLGHIGTNVLLFYAVARREPRWFWLAFVYKSAIDAVAGFAVVKGLTTTPVQIWTIEAIAAVWGIAGLLITLWISRRYQPPLEEIMQE
jgi:uncharacterized membrane protein YhfC